MDRRQLLLSLGALALPASLTRPGRSAEIKVDRDVVYGEPNGTPLLMDIYHPEGPGPHPAVILVHGGGWIGGSKAGHVRLSTLLAQNGYLSCAINYRLAPRYPYPAAFDDCQRAVRWLRSRAEEYAIDRKRIGAFGDSAGGHLVGLIGCRETRDNSDRKLARYSSRPNAVVAYYGAFELVKMWDIEQAHRPLTDWLGGSPQGREKLYAETSPVMMANRKACPHLIIHGTADVVNPEEQSHLYHQALLKHRVDSTLLILPGAGHGWAPDTEHARRAEGAMLAFFGKHLGRRPGAD